MTKIVLSTQEFLELTSDEDVTELKIGFSWLAGKSHQRLGILSQLYLNVKKIDLSELEFSGENVHLISDIVSAFPELSELVLSEAAASNPALIKKVYEGFTFLQKLSFVNPPEIKDNFSYLNPYTWDFSFWEDSRTVRHHESLRDLFNVASISQGASNILGDWNRISECKIDINGSSIFSLVRQDNDKKYFSNLEALKSFFLEHLLAQLPQEQQAKALDFVLKTVHQGGLQNPVTASIFQYCSRNSSAPQLVDAANYKNGRPGQYREMKFNATKDGFSVHEILIQNRMAYPITAGEQAGEMIMPDGDYSYVFKAEAKLSIHWSAESESPSLRVDDVGIRFGSELVKAHLDGRWLYQKWLDNLSYYSGYNTVSEEESSGRSLGL